MLIGAIPAQAQLPSKVDVLGTSGLQKKLLGAALAHSTAFQK